MTTAIQKQDPANQLKGWLNSPNFKTEVDRLLPQHLSGERFVRVALNAALTTPKLAECTKVSVFKCLLDLAALGIEPNGRDAHLIPYRDNRGGVTVCTLIVDFKGLVQIVRRAPGVVDVSADVVRENDDFEFKQGTESFLRHSFGLKDRGEIVGAFAIVKLLGGESFVVLTLDEIKEVQRGSRAGSSGPWKTHFAEMAKKTAFRRLTKWLSLPSEVSAAIERAETIERPKALPFPDASAETINLAPGLPETAEIEAEPAPEPRKRRAPQRKQPAGAQEAERGHNAPAEDADALRAQFCAILDEAGASFSDFQIWANETGMIEGADALSSVADLPLADIKRCIAARVGLVKQLREMKGGK